MTERGRFAPSFCFLDPVCVIRGLGYKITIDEKVDIAIKTN